MSVLKNLDLFNIESDFTEEQKMIRNSVREYVRKKIMPEISRWDQEMRAIPREILQDFAKALGVVGVCFSGTYGDYEFLGLII